VSETDFPPTPWSVSGPHAFGVFVIDDARGNDFGLEGSDRRLLRRVTARVNCHDELLASLEEMLAAFEDGTDQCCCTNGGHASPAPCPTCRARKVIAGAKGETT
jgi:hypothetical protein